MSEQLLRAAKFNVMAIRVVEPGLLGLPRRLLVPVAGHPRGARSSVSFLRLMAPDVTRIVIVLIKEMDRLSFRALPNDRAKALLADGRRYVHRIERELRAALGEAIHFDASAVLADDAAKEIVIAANRHQARLIYMGASERTLSERLFYGSPLEQVLRNAPCDVAVYRGIE